MPPREIGWIKGHDLCYGGVQHRSSGDGRPRWQQKQKKKNGVNDALSSFTLPSHSKASIRIKADENKDGLKAQTFGFIIHSDRSGVNMNMWPNCRSVMCVFTLYLFCFILFFLKKGITHTTCTRIHVLSALAERVPCSAPTTSTKSGQADGSNERSAKIIQKWTSVTFTCRREHQSLIYTVLDSALHTTWGGWEEGGWREMDEFV